MGYFGLLHLVGGRGLVEEHPDPVPVRPSDARARRRKGQSVRISNALQRTPPVKGISHDYPNASQRLASANNTNVTVNHQIGIPRQEDMPIYSLESQAITNEKHRSQTGT